MEARCVDVRSLPLTTISSLAKENNLRKYCVDCALHSPHAVPYIKLVWHFCSGVDQYTCGSFASRIEPGLRGPIPKYHQYLSTIDAKPQCG